MTDIETDGNVDNKEKGINPEEFDDDEILEEFGKHLDPLPDNVESAVTLTKLDNVIDELKNYEVLNENEKICLQDCIKRKFEDAKDAILKVCSGTLSPEKFMEQYQLAINEEKTETENGKIKRKNAMSDKTKMFLISKYNETIFPLIGIDRFSDPSATLGENVVDDQFVDRRFYSQNFELNENFENLSGGKRIGQGILDAIAQIEGRISDGGNLGEKQNIREFLEQEIAKMNDIDEQKIAQELWLSINEKLGGDDDLRISIEDRAYLFAQNMIFMEEYRMANPNIRPIELYQLLNSNQNKLLHQTLWDVNTITSSDHGIKHVLRGDLTFAENVFDQLNDDQRKELFKNNNEGKEPNNDELQQFQSRLHVLTMQATIDHDFGYTNVVNRMFDQEGYGEAYYMQSDHPLWSTLYIQNNAERYNKYFGETGYKVLLDSIPGHGTAQTESFSKITGGTANPTEFVSGILSTVDCAGAPSDFKISYMFAQKEVIGSLFNVYDFIKKGDIEGAKQGLYNLSITIKEMPEGAIKDSWLKGVNAFLKDGGYKMMDIDEFNKIFTFYFEKFLGAYGVRTTVNTETGDPECGINENGGWRVSFELSGKSFEYIMDKFGVNIALKSFISVCDDYGIKKKGKAMNIITGLIENAGEKWRKDDNPDKSSLSSYIIREFENSEIGELDEGTSIEKKENGIVLKGPNNVEITLNFNGRSYEGFNDSIEKINDINGYIDDLLDLLDDYKGKPDERASITNSLAQQLANLGTYIDTSNIAYDEILLTNIANNIVNLSDNSNIEEIKSQVEKIRSSYYFQLESVGASNLG